MQEVGNNDKKKKSVKGSKQKKNADKDNKVKTSNIKGSKQNNNADKENKQKNLGGGIKGSKQKENAKKANKQKVSAVKDETPSSVRCSPSILYTTEDSFYTRNRVMAIDTSENPPKLFDEMQIMDTNDVFSSLLSVEMRASLVNFDKTVNIDPEGIDIASDGGFWLVHEGAGSFNNLKDPIESPNVLLKLSNDAVIEQAIFLPAELNAVQFESGFSGVAEWDTYAVVAFQRAWNNETYPRIGMYNTEDETWSFRFYPLDTPESQNGGWVGLADITSVDFGKFLVLERDDQGGPDAAIKRIYSIDLTETDQELGLLSKQLYKDLYSTLASATNGPVVEKVDGMAVDGSGNLWIVNGNDGVDNNSGETLLLQV